MNFPQIKLHLPGFVRDCRDVFQVWAFIKPKYGTYKERREFIWAEFRPLLEELDAGDRAPSDETTSVVLRQVDAHAT